MLLATCRACAVVPSDSYVVPISSLNVPAGMSAANVSVAFCFCVTASVTTATDAGSVIEPVVRTVDQAVEARRLRGASRELVLVEIDFDRFRAFCESRLPTAHDRLRHNGRDLGAPGRG